MNDIKDALSRVADTSAPAPLSLEHVRGRARQIRRRRTVTAIVGSAAAIVAIAGIGLAVSPSGSDDGSVPPASRTPSPTTAADSGAVGPVFPVRLDVPAEQTFGGEPQVPYWHDGQIIDTDGTATPLPERPLKFARDTERGGWVVISAGEAHADLVRVAVDGRVTDGPLPTFPDGLAVGADGQLATLSQQAGRWWLRASGMGLSKQVSLDRSVEWAAIDGIRPDGRVVVQVDGATKVADTFTGQVSDLPDAAAAVPSSVLPLTAIAGQDGTWTARREDGTTQWSLDWAGVSSFSPDGRYVALAGDPRHRIGGSVDWDSDHATGTLWIRTAADLLPVAAFTAPEGGYFWSWTWDGDELLATVYVKDTGEWSLVRLSSDGFTVGRGTAQPGRGEQPAYVFGVG
jgi:hypothetical protein